VEKKKMEKGFAVFAKTPAQVDEKKAAVSSISFRGTDRKIYQGRNQMYGKLESQ